MNNQIEPPPPFIRDFLYVDLGRVRSLLSQLNQGVPDKVEEVNERLSRWDAGIKALGVVDRAKQEIERSAETRTLGDLHFSIFEEAAEVAGFLKDATQEASVASNWTNGTIAQLTDDYKILRVTCPTRILDAHHFANILEQVASAGIIAKGPKKAALEGIKKSIRMMYPPGIGILALPVSRDHDTFSFSGTLLERSEYIEPERATLLARHGAKPSEWTTVGLVTRAGRASGTTTLAGMPGLADGQTLNRRKLEEMIENFTDYLESAGLSEAPTSPGIAIIPLAIYRTIPAKI
jgi:hypothetical protein